MSVIIMMLMLALRARYADTPLAAAITLIHYVVLLLLLLAHYAIHAALLLC